MSMRVKVLHTWYFLVLLFVEREREPVAPCDLSCYIPDGLTICPEVTCL